jgi:DNA-directed RNA polymerase specialized sigma24 family protein
MPTILQDPIRLESPPPEPPPPAPEPLPTPPPIEVPRRLSGEPGADFAEDVESAMENHGENWKARVVLTKIPNAQRRVIELIYLEHLSIPRVAERLALPIETVESRCLEGVRRLRKDLVVAPQRLS